MAEFGTTSLWDPYEMSQATTASCRGSCGPRGGGWRSSRPAAGLLWLLLLSLLLSLLLLSLSLSLLLVVVVLLILILVWLLGLAWGDELVLAALPLPRVQHEDVRRVVLGRAKTGVSKPTVYMLHICPSMFINKLLRKRHHYPKQ